MIRQASFKDIPWIITQLHEFHKLLPTGLVKYPGDEYTTKWFKEWISKHVVLIGEHGGERAGFIVAQANQHVINPGTTLLSELFWWVAPEHRRSTIGFRLMRSLIEIAKQTEGIDYLTVSLEAASPVSDNTLCRLGFQPAERSFIMEVKDASSNDGDCSCS